jgi:hypothetical protein
LLFFQFQQYDDHYVPVNILKLWDTFNAPFPFSLLTFSYKEDMKYVIKNKEIKTVSTKEAQPLFI